MPTTKRVRTISEFHRLRNLPKPEHPLVSVVNYADIRRTPEMSAVSWVMDFYMISVKRGVGAKFHYGQQQYDFDEGVMFFIAPGQVFRIVPDAGNGEERTGWMLLIHPDFIWNTSLATAIRQYAYFDYEVHEALFLSDKEEATLNTIIQTIRQEYHANTDRFSQGIIIAQIETMLNYAERFYHRQFLTRRIANHGILNKLEALLDAHFSNEEASARGLPTVQYFAGELAVSPKYLSSLLKVLTGQTAQQHIHDKLIERAKERLSTTALSVSELAYELGFEHPQSFSKLFKSKTALSPLAFRQSFNQS